MNSSKNVLIFFPAEPFDYGGQAMFVLNMYKNSNNKNIKFTFCTPFGFTNKKLIDLINERKDNIICFNKDINSTDRIKFIKESTKLLFKQNHFDVVHIQSGSIFALNYAAKIAKKSHTEKIIVHSHNTGVNSLKTSILKFLSDLNIGKYADVFLACSDLAAEWKFPKKIIKNKNYTVINNGIDTDKFVFNSSVRENYRKHFNLGNALTLCNVGRFSEQKNHEFIVAIAKALKEKNLNFKFILVGEGELKNKIVDEIKSLNLTENFILLEKRSDVAQIMMASDIFVLPSLFEGFPITLIESQATGLISISSSTITKEAEISDLIQFLPIDDENLWADKIVNLAKNVNNLDREKYAKLVADAGYNAQQSAKVLEDIYLN